MQLVSGKVTRTVMFAQLQSALNAFKSLVLESLFPFQFYETN